jgi:hypothetical protein
MKTQWLRTDKMTMGPFSTLILNSGTRAQCNSETPSKTCDDTPTSPLAILRQDEATLETQRVPVGQQTPGVFVSWILELVQERAAERLRFAAEHIRPEPTLCVRIQFGR